MPGLDFASAELLGDWAVKDPVFLPVSEGYHYYKKRRIKKRLRKLLANQKFKTIKINRVRGLEWAVSVVWAHSVILEN